jgi:S-adenosylmethionine decarboxylase proenzyme
MFIAGQHIIVDMFEIDESKFIQLSEEHFESFDKQVETMLSENSMSLLGKTIHHFDCNYVGAMTCLYLLSESHLSMHTWPEKRYISLDCYTCGVCNTQNLVNGIIQLFQPQRVKQTSMQRGGIEPKLVITNYIQNGDMYIAT